MIALIIICVVSFINKKASCLDPIFFRKTPIHGTSTSFSTNSFMCPGNGAITGITYYADSYIRSLAFNCSSSDGIRVFGPYGKETGTPGNLTCPSGQYISSFHGSSGGDVHSLAVRCRPITNDLKGNGTDRGTMTGPSAAVGNAFDDWPYSNGARIVNVTIWSSLSVQGIQFDYANIPVELCADNCENYKEEFGFEHGNPFYEELKFTVATCADNGVFTAVKLRTYGRYVISLQFICNSDMDERTSPVFGAKMDLDATTLLSCPPGMIIGSISTSGFISGIGIRCVVFGDTLNSLYFDVKADTSETVRDDVKYLDRGWRPVLFRINYNDYGIHGFQVKYGNSNITTNCKVTMIEPIDQTTVRATSNGRKVIGIASATSCKKGPQLLKMQYSEGVEESVSLDTTDGGEENWDDTVSVTYTTGVTFIVAIETSIGSSHSVGGTRHWSTTNSNATSTSTERSAGPEITYNTPGACAIVGYVNRFEVDSDNVAARYHYDCEHGKKPPRLGTIKLRSTTYGLAYFEDYQFTYTDTATCNQKSDCVKRIGANSINADPSSFYNKFINCSRPL